MAYGGVNDNPNKLRVIKTARTLEAINEAAENGLWPVVLPVKPSKDIHFQLAVYQHKETGKINTSGDCRNFFDDDLECVIPYETFYPYQFPAPFAAYLVPSDLSLGEKVWLEDVIEDVVAMWGNQGYHPRLESGEAIWDGSTFKVLFDPDTDAPVMIG